MKTLLVTLALFISSWSFQAAAEKLTEFDYPLLLGDWYWFSTNDEGIESDGESYTAMNIKFTSNYDFVVRLLRADGSVDQWKGKYDVDETNITFRSSDQPEQLHSYMLSYNQFVLDGARFTKLAPENLPGQWHASRISGNDVDEHITGLSILLRPDFLFSVEVKGTDGKMKEHRGIYYIEDNNIVLLYEDGQHESQYKLGSDNTLTLSNKLFGMEAIMQREY
ncbi:lipocalin family protein [Photobacterium swingsii]|uniref:lipocalin family protein n=1 Tax=Photobacterium swingsii TaxID=680026 RepID=UPI00352EA76B